MGYQKRLTRNTGFVLISQIVNMLFSMLFTVYAARILGPGNFGLYALIGTMSFIFFYFGNLGIGPMAIREISRDKKNVEDLFNHILSLRMSLVISSYPILVLVVNLLGYNEDVKYLIYIAGITAIFSTFSGSFRILYISFERFKIPSLVSMLVSFLSTISNIIILYLGYGLKGIVWIAMLGSLSGAVISGIWVRKKFIKYRFTFDLSRWKDLLTQSTPFAIIAFFQQANMHLTTLFLSKIPGSLPGKVAIGYYRTSSSLCQKALLIPQSFNQAALPTVASNTGNLKVIENLIDRSTETFLVLIIFPLILITTFFPKEIIAIFFGKEYLPSAPALTILGWAYALQTFNAPVNLALSASREIRKFIPWAALGFIINLILALPLIIYYSFLGAAIAFLISKVFETLTRSYLLQTIYGIKRLEIQESLKILSPIAVTCIILFIAKVNSVHTGILLILTLVLYAISIFSFKSSREGIAFLINGLRGKTIMNKGIDVNR